MIDVSHPSSQGPHVCVLQLAVVVCLAVLSGGAAAASCSTERLPNAVPASDAPFTLQYQRSASVDQTTFYFKVGHSGIRGRDGLQGRFCRKRWARLCFCRQAPWRTSKADAPLRAPLPCPRSAPRAPRSRCPPSACVWQTGCCKRQPRTSNWPTRRAASATRAPPALAGGSGARSWGRCPRHPRWVLLTCWWWLGGGKRACLSRNTLPHVDCGIPPPAPRPRWQTHYGARCAQAALNALSWCPP